MAELSALTAQRYKKKILFHPGQYPILRLIVESPKLLGDSLNSLGNFLSAGVTASLARIANFLDGLLSGLGNLLGVVTASNGSAHQRHDCERHKYLFHCTLNLTVYNKTNFAAANVGMIFEFYKLLKIIYYI